MTGPVTNWNITTIGTKQYLVIDTASFRIPLDWDPTSNMFIAVAAPNGGIGSFPALVQGAPGAAATFSSTVALTALAPTDPTPDSASITSLGGNAYQLNLALHDGATGASGTMTLTPSSFGTPVYKYILRVNSATTGFELQPELNGDRYYPATISSAPSGNPSYTLASVAVPSQPFNWRPVCEGYCQITGTGTDLQAYLMVRLNNATSGSVVAQGTQAAAQYPPCHVLSAACPPGSAGTYDQVNAGSSATLYLRVERQSGTSTFTTSSSTTLFSVSVQPIP